MKGGRQRQRGCVAPPPAAAARAAPAARRTPHSQCSNSAGAPAIAAGQRACCLQAPLPAAPPGYLQCLLQLIEFQVCKRVDQDTAPKTQTARFVEVEAPPAVEGATSFAPACWYTQACKRAHAPALARASQVQVGASLQALRRHTQPHATLSHDRDHGGLRVGGGGVPGRRPRVSCG